MSSNAAEERARTATAVSDVIVETLDDLWNNRNYQVIDDAMAEECLHRTPIVSDNEPRTGRDIFKKEFLEPMHAGFEDLAYISHEVLTDLDAWTVVNRWTFTGTHTGTFCGFKATKKHVTFSGITVNRISTDAKIIECNTFFDRHALFQQLGTA